MSPVKKALPARAARLFEDPARPADSHVVHVDGASRGNPGPAAYGVVIYRPDGAEVFRLGKYLGRATNNVAEYYALLTALDFAVVHGITKLRVRSDSELLVRQMQGHYKVKSTALRPLHEHARKLARRFSYIAFEHIPRELNEAADELANEALDHPGRKPVSRGEKASAASRQVPLATRTVRARYSRGALYPAEPLGLPEGTEVDLTIHRTR